MNQLTILFASLRFEDKHIYLKSNGYLPVVYNEVEITIKMSKAYPFVFSNSMFETPFQALFCGLVAPHRGTVFYVAKLISNCDQCTILRPSACKRFLHAESITGFTYIGLKSQEL